ncbi:MAG: metallophosphoesterase family protein [Acidobacteria bacterium]|nr:metallophosphoesterase family protein [Acidobacteriota bacterium]
MRYLILSDIHANLEALDAVLNHAQGSYDHVVCLGDVVGYGPDPNKVIDRVRALEPVAIVRGNHDKAGCGIDSAEEFNPAARQAALWTREQLRAENLAYLRQLPPGPISCDTFQIVHGSVRDEDEYIFFPREALENLRLTESSLTFCGHTHFQGGFALQSSGRMQVLRVSLGRGVARAELALEPNHRYLVNPGSIGQPRDGDARAAFACWNTDRRVVEYWRVPYSVETTQEKMQAAGLPQPLITRLSLGR